MITPLFIPSIIEALVAKVALKLDIDIFFDKGHYNEVVRNLTNKEGNPDKPQKYPLVWLVMDMKESVSPQIGIYANIDVHLIIAQDTTVTRTMDERINDVFIPILYPIYEALLNEIMDTREFANSYNTLIKHDKYDRYYWGGQDNLGNGTANLFNDFIDAIEIKNLTLAVKKQFCITPQLN